MNNRPWSLADKQLTLYCHIQPGSRQNQLAGLHDNRVKIQLKTPPVDGRANKALIEFLARLCKRPKSAITIQAGFSSRRKTITIDRLDHLPEQLSLLIRQ